MNSVFRLNFYHAYRLNAGVSIGDGILALGSGVSLEVGVNVAIGNVKSGPGVLVGEGVFISRSGSFAYHNHIALLPK